MSWNSSPLSFALSVVLIASACASRGAPAGTPEMKALNEMIQWPSPAFQRIGRLSATGKIPFIGDVMQLAGPHDSTVVVLALSFGNRALSFGRDGSGFIARYRVDIGFQGVDGKTIGSKQVEVVRVASFAETQRTDESVVFQRSFMLEPGTYTLRISVQDPSSTGESRAQRQLEIERFPDASFSTVAAVHFVEPRVALTDPFSGLLNPRGMIPYRGVDTLELYLEGYRLPGPTELPVRVLGGKDEVLYSTSVRFTGGRPVESQLIAISDVSASMEDMVIEVGAGPTVQRVRAIASLGNCRAISNFDAMISLLRFFLMEPGKLHALRRTRPSEREEAWCRFWETTDPDPRTPENEALDEYLSRVSIANETFFDGPEGWLTDRGEVYATLGEPDLIEYLPNIVSLPSGDSRTELQRLERVVRWTYYQHDAVLEFVSVPESTRLMLRNRAVFERARWLATQDEEDRRRFRSQQ